MEPRHYGYVVDEMSGAVLPFSSAYARRDDAERAALAAARECGLEPTWWAVLPASQEEAAREEVDRVAADSDGWAVLPAVELEPGAAAREARGARELADGPRWLPAMPADAAADALAAHGYQARYSKGGNLWVVAPDGEDMAPWGLRWSPKRGQWWARLEQGRAVMTQYTRRGDFAA